jgi:hypothetical protein
VFFNLENLGEKTLNKIAEMALSSQIEKAEALNVQIKTDPSKLAKGELESLAIAGKGLVMDRSLQMHELEIIFNSIAVSPLKALVGNIQLTHPSSGLARAVLTQADLEKALNTEAIARQLSNCSLDSLACRIFASDKVGIYAKVSLPNNVQQEIYLSVTPAIAPTGRGVVLKNLQSDPENETSSRVTSVLLAKMEKLFNLSNFQMEGISLQIERITLEEGKITLQAKADISSFPASRS